MLPSHLYRRDFLARGLAGPQRAALSTWLRDTTAPFKPVLHFPQSLPRLLSVAFSVLKSLRTEGQVLRARTQAGGQDAMAGESPGAPSPAE